jgi:hypothetical protein
MNKIFRILCLMLCPAIANATNFEVCVNEAKTNHNDTTAAGYTSYKCEGTTAEKLLARPDECPGGTKPSLGSLVRKSRQFDDGLWSSMSWTAGKCIGSCETRSYDSKDTTYLCEVRVYDEGRPAAESNRERLAPGPGAGPGFLRPRPGGPDAGTAGPGSRQAANEARLRRRPPPAGPAWSPPPPRRYSHYNRYSRNSRYGPGFSRRPWFEPPPPDPYPYYEGYRQQPNYEGYRQQPRCDCN